MVKITKEEAKIIADKVNTLIQSTYLQSVTFNLTDFMQCSGIAEDKSKRILSEFVRQKILDVADGIYSANSQRVENIKKMAENAELKHEKEKNK